MFKRRGKDPILTSFLVMAERLDHAQRSLLAAIPTARDAGVPLGEALDAFEHWLAEAEALMETWRTEETEASHARCTDALTRAKDAADHLRQRHAQGPIEFEPLNLLVGDVLIPLEEFADAERTLRRRKRK